MDRLGTTTAANRGIKNKIQQRYYTNGDAISQFNDARLDAGIAPPNEIIGDGQLHRFKIDGKYIIPPTLGDFNDMLKGCA